MNVLITGASGFTARYLIDLISGEADRRLYLTDRVPKGNTETIDCDLTQKRAVEEMIGNIRPGQIYHLAGSFTNNYDIDYPINVIATKHILDALLKFDIPARILLIGSAAEYGLIGAGDNPVREDHVLKPLRVHGLTKTYQTQMMNFYFKVFNMDIVMARTFNLYGGDHISSLTFIGKVCDQIEKVKKGKLSRIVVGNLGSKRDYIDVREAVQLYKKIMEKGKAGEVYNVGRGKPVKMKDVLDGLLKEAGLDWKIVEEKDPGVPDKTDVPEIYADVRKIKELGA